MTPGPNAPCPCGSGKKYKRCHGLATSSAQRPVGPASDLQLLTAAERHHEAADLPSAEALYRQLLERDGRNVPALAGLAGLLHQAGRPREAEDAFRQLTRLAPTLAAAHCNLGVVLLAQGRTEEALQTVDRAIALQPAYALALATRGAALKHLDRFDEAEQALRAAIALDDRIVSAHSNLGALLMRSHHPAAMASLDRALALDPRFAGAHFQRAILLQEQGRIADAVAGLRRTISLAPEMTPAWSSLLLTLLYADDVTPEEVLVWHRRLDTVLDITQGRHAPRLFPNPAQPQRRLRVGVLSPDLRRHSVACFVEPLLEHHDRAALEVVCYHDNALEDEVSARLKPLAARWLNTSALDHEQLLATIAADRIDVLIELAGHTGLRMPMLARRPAPVLATWLGYPASTGLSAIGYRISDAVADPPAHAALHTEQLIRLPNSYFCYQPLASAPDPGPPPAVRRGTVTFGSFNNIPKLTPATVELWAGVLHAVAGSRLLLKAAGLADAAVCRRLAEAFAARGVDPQRIEFRAWQPSTDAHLAAYGDIDIALDTWPYNGATTSCEALWMGVPVVSLAGDRSQSRMGASILAAAGCAACVADDAAGFAAIAARLAGDLPALKTLRAGLRSRLAASPLLDGRRFARDFEQALRSMWQAWCAQQASQRQA